MTGEELYERYLDSLHYNNKNKKTVTEWKKMTRAYRKVWDMLAEQLEPRED